MKSLLKEIELIGIVPVVKIIDPSDALPMAQALKSGGINCMEITFRSEFAIQSIKDITDNYPDIIVGAGTVLSIEQAQIAVDAGAKFIVTPGFNSEIVKWCIDKGILIIPGVQTATEIENAMSLGLDTLKFFPAESSGGVKKLKDFYGPYNNVRFMPSGGINSENLNDYLELPNVIAVGTSFMLPPISIQRKDWNEVTLATKVCVKKMLNYRLEHVGINVNDENTARENAKRLSELFGLPYYEKPKSHFVGRYFEFMNEKGRGANGHIAIYTPFPERALYQLKKHNINPIVESITYNKISNKINFSYLDLEMNGFAFHLINPDIKM